MHGPVPAGLTASVESTAGLPLVSIVIPAFNAAQYLKACLSSVLREIDAARALGKLDFEVILIDDCSADATGTLAGDLLSTRNDARILTHARNRGAAAARNTGIDASRGDYILFLDSDNVLLDGALSRIVEVLLEGNDADVIILGMDLIDEHGERTGAFYGDRVPANPIRRLQADPFLLLDGNCMDAFGIVRGCAARAARYDESLSQLSDWDFWLRLRHGHGCVFSMLEEPVGGYRIRAGQMSQVITPQSRPYAREMLQIHAKALGMAMQLNLPAEAVQRLLARVQAAGCAYMERSANSAASGAVSQTAPGQSPQPAASPPSDLATIQLNFGARTVSFAFRGDSAHDKSVISRVFQDDAFNLTHWEQGRRFLEYYGTGAGSKPGLIIDACANIGASAVYFLEAFRNSFVCALEPEIGDFRVLQFNTRSYQNKTNLHAAIAAADAEGGADGRVPAISVPSILKAAAATIPMIFKCDIEGAADGVFSGSPTWMRQFPLIIASGHSVPAAAHDDFDLVHRGESIFLFNRALLASSRS